MRKLLLILLLNTIIFANSSYEKPSNINIKSTALQIKEFKPYCSELLNKECFIFPQLYILGYSKNNLIAYIIKKSLDAEDAEDDGEEYNFIIQDLNTNKKIFNFLYRYDTEEVSNNERIIYEKEINLKTNKLLSDKTSTLNDYQTFNFFWDKKKTYIIKILNKYSIDYNNKNLLWGKNTHSLHLTSSKIKYKNMFPGESFIKELKIYKNNHEIYSKKYKTYIYTSRILKSIIHPHTKQPIYILGSIQRGATGEPHLVTLDIFAEKENAYWDYIKDNKWHKVPLGEGSINKIDLSYIKSLYKDADFIGILYPIKYKKFECDSESSECAKYEAKIVTTFKGVKKEGNLVFIDDLTNAPDVYRNNAIYILYKEDNIYYQDAFIQIVPSKKWIKVFKNFTLKYKSRIKSSLSQIKKIPNRTVAYYNLGDAYWALGEKEKAVKAYTTYIEQMCHKGLQKKIPEEVLERVKVK